MVKSKFNPRERERERDKISGNSGKRETFPRPWILSDKSCCDGHKETFFPFLKRVRGRITRKRRKKEKRKKKKRKEKEKKEAS